MNYFKYVKSFDVNRVLRIYHEVRKLKGYAMTIYKNLWEDALDKSFFHILDNFDEESGGDLEHYATKVVGTILLNKYHHEIEHDITLENAMDQKSLNETSNNPLNVLLKGEEEKRVEDLRVCIDYLTPMFVKDYKFFLTSRSEFRKCEYTGLFEKFSADVIKRTMQYFSEKYGEAMTELDEFKKTCRYRCFPSDRYKDSLDENIEYEGMFNGTVLYSTQIKKYSRIFYKLDISELLDYVIDSFFLPESNTHKTKVEGKDVYCTLSGQIVLGVEELRETLENEIVGAILAKISSLKVVNYNRGEDIILSSTRDINVGWNFDFFGEELVIEFKRVTAKKIERK